MTTTASDWEALLSGVCAEPEDWDRYRVAADWCEEHGRQGWADCLRWCAAGRKRARECHGWLWYDATEQDGDFDPESDLPPGLYRHLRRFHDHWRGEESWKEYLTCRAALMALLGAWAEARGAGWVPGEGD